MGWSRGADLFTEIAQIITDHVNDEDDREAMYMELIELFQDYDCDNLDECAGVEYILDEVLAEAGIISKPEEEE